MGVFRLPVELPTALSMARRSPIDFLLTTRVDALAAALPAALGGEPTAVHRARVASRRLREVVPVFAAVAPSATRAGAAVKRVTRALGPARELDVTAALYAALTAVTPVHPLAHAAVVRAFARGRAAAVRATKKALSTSHRRKLWAAVDALTADLAGLPVANAGLPVARVVAAVQARVAQRSRLVTGALDDLGVMYAPERLHAVRIAVKKLRYALEIAGDLRHTPTAASLRQLRAVQTMLGRVHDLHVLVEHLRQVEARIVTRSRPASRDLRRVVRSIDDECRQLHASFLGRRAALGALASPLSAPAVASRRRTAA